MDFVEVNKREYQQPNEYVYDSSEEDEVASLYDLGLYKRHLKSRRRVRAHNVRSFDNDSFGEEIVQIECVECREDPDESIEYKWQDLRWLWDNRVHEPNTALIAVEACHISPWDVAIRRGHYRVAIPCVLGSNFVGVVQATSNEASQWRIGRRVAGLPLTGSNAKYVTARTDTLFDVPKKLDASEVSCVLSIYLPAFQALHHGQRRPQRYSHETLQKKRVLITGGGFALPEALALIRLAHYGGALEVYCTAEREHHSVLRQMYAIPLEAHMDDWLPSVRGRMDVVIDFDYVQNESASWKALSPNGRLVWYFHPSKQRESGHLWWFDHVWEQVKMSLIERASIYKLFDSLEESHYQAEMDFEFLLRLLAQRQIRPEIDQYIGLNGVKAAHKDLQTRSLNGAIICEPWKDEDAISVATTAASTAFSTSTQSLGLGLIPE